jgi:hypothetical protein
VAIAGGAPATVSFSVISMACAESIKFRSISIGRSASLGGCRTHHVILR